MYWLAIFCRVSLILDLCNVLFIMRLGQCVGGGRSHREKSHFITLPQVRTMNRFISLEVNLTTWLRYYLPDFSTMTLLFFSHFQLYPLEGIRYVHSFFFFFLPPSLPFLIICLFIPFFLSFNQYVLRVILHFRL